MLTKVDLTQKLSMFAETWVPRIVGGLNGQYVKLVKFQGVYVWHHHRDEDELFMVLKGQIQLHLRDGIVELRKGEFCIVPRGIEHRPMAEELAHVLLFEPAATRNTGNAQNEFTIEAQNLPWI